MNFAIVGIYARNVLLFRKLLEPDDIVSFARIITFGIILVFVLFVCGILWRFQSQADCCDRVDENHVDAEVSSSAHAIMPADPKTGKEAGKQASLRAIDFRNDSRTMVFLVVTAVAVSSLSRRNEWAARRGAYSFMQMSLNRMHQAGGAAATGTTTASRRYHGRHSTNNGKSPSREYIRISTYIFWRSTSKIISQL